MICSSPLFVGQIDAAFLYFLQYIYVVKLQIFLLVLFQGASAAIDVVGFNVFVRHLLIYLLI